MKNKALKICRSDLFPFVVLFIIYSILFSFVQIINDDAALMATYANLKFKGLISLAVDDYFNWSSRVLVNTVIHFILGKGKLIWLVLNSLVAVVFGWSISTLFIKQNKRQMNWVIVFFILLFPITHMSSAGWLVTFMTYFWPIAFGFVALIPIKKTIDQEKFTALEMIFYALSIIYAANDELELVFLLSIYGVFTIYFFFKHVKKIKFFLFQIFLLIVSLLFTFTCPGNGTRNGSEIGTWFPNYEMLNLFDKIDLGVSRIANEFLYGNYILVIVFCVLLTILIWKKYSNYFCRIVSLIPSSVVLLFGPLKNITMYLFPKLNIITQAISEQGVYTPFNCGFMALLKFTLPCFVILCLIISLILAFSKSNDQLFSVTMIIASFAASAAMAFSPTIFASGYRTATVLFMTLIVLCVMVVNEILKRGWIKENCFVFYRSIAIIISFVVLLNDLVDILTVV